jgi:hypothetical protein
MRKTKAIRDALDGKAHVSRSEPHWYLHVIDEGCVLCSAGGEDTRVRVRGKRPKNPRDRYLDEGPSTYACGSHFC